MFGFNTLEMTLDPKYYEVLENGTVILDCEKIEADLNISAKSIESVETFMFNSEQKVMIRYSRPETWSEKEKQEFTELFTGQLLATLSN